VVDNLVDNFFDFSKERLKSDGRSFFFLSFSGGSFSKGTLSYPPLIHQVIHQVIHHSFERNSHCVSEKAKAMSFVKDSSSFLFLNIYAGWYVGTIIVELKTIAFP